MTQTRVLVVGGGIAGLSLGSELASDHDVVVLEAEATLAAHSTGRSAALFLDGYGPEPVQALTRASEPEFLRLEARPGTPRLLTPRGALLTAWDAATATGLEKRLDSEPGIAEVTAAEAAAICPALRATDLLVAGHDPRARDIDVMALHSAYLAILRGRGGQTYTRARVVSARRNTSGWTVSTADGRTWDADVIVNAAGAWGDQVAELCQVSGHGLTACRRTVVIARPGTAIDPRWPLVADASESWYFKPEGASLLVSPADETPVEPGDTRPEPLDVAAALERVNRVTTLALRSVQTSWAGLRTFAPDRAPVVGPHPDERSLFCYLGQGGYGIQMAPALARAGAEIFRSGTLADTGLAEALDPRRFQISPLQQGSAPDRSH